MKSRLFAAAVAFLLWTVPHPAFAHRLNEYLQATTIAVEQDRVTAQLRLTPGVAVARTALADIDTDGDGLLSDTEQRAYAVRVLRDLSLTVDGSGLLLQPVSSTFPSVAEMQAGRGEILLTLRADVPRGGKTRKLVFENHHQSAISAYLVNCLSPDDPAIRVTAQSRNYEQSFYRVDYTQMDSHVSPISVASAPNSRPSSGPPSQRLSFVATCSHGVYYLFTGYKQWLFVGALVLIWSRVFLRPLSRVGLRRKLAHRPVETGVGV